MSALPSKADMFSVEMNVCFVPIADLSPLLGAEPFCVSAPLPQLSPSVAGFCGQAHRTLSISPTSEFDVELMDFDLL